MNDKNTDSQSESVCGLNRALSRTGVDASYCSWCNWALNDVNMFNLWGEIYACMMEFDYHKSLISMKDHPQVKYTAMLTDLRLFSRPKT